MPTVLSPYCIKSTPMYGVHADGVVPVLHKHHTNLPRACRRCCPRIAQTPHQSTACMPTVLSPYCTNTTPIYRGHADGVVTVLHKHHTNLPRACRRCCPRIAQTPHQSTAGMPTVLSPYYINTTPIYRGHADGVVPVLHKKHTNVRRACRRCCPRIAQTPHQSTAGMQTVLSPYCTNTTPIYRVHADGVVPVLHKHHTNLPRACRRCCPRIAQTPHQSTAGMPTVLSPY